MKRRATVTNLNWFEWSLFTLVVVLRCQTFRKSSNDHICSKTRQATTIFLQFFVKKIVKNRLSANTTRGSIENIIPYWYRVKENFIGFPTKKTACKSKQNSLQAWPICQGMYVHYFQLWPILGALSLWTSTILPLLMLSKKSWPSKFDMNAPNFTDFSVIEWKLQNFEWNFPLYWGITFIFVLGRPKLGKQNRHFVLTFSCFMAESLCLTMRFPSWFNIRIAGN